MISIIKRRLQWLGINLKYAFRIRKPRLIGRLIKNMLLVVVFRRKLLRYVDFAIGFKCNLNCQHCFATSLTDDQRQVVTPQEYRAVASQAMKLGAVAFSFQGGEPLLYQNLPEYIAAARPATNLISVTTNGTLLTDENLEKLKKWRVDVLTISLDSGIASEHDAFRGLPGSFEKITDGIVRALAYGFRVTIGTVITRGNLYSEGVAQLIEFSSRLRVILMLIYGIPIGRWKGREDILLAEQDYQYVHALVRNHPYVRTDFYANYHAYGCGAVKEILYMNPYGDVFACPFIHYPLGNVKEEPLATIRARALKSQRYREYRDVCLATLKEVYGA